MEFLRAWGVIFFLKKNFHEVKISTTKSCGEICMSSPKSGGCKQITQSVAYLRKRHAHNIYN